MSHLSAVYPRLSRRSPAVLAAVLRHGEVVTVDKWSLQKRRRAVRGFVLPTHTKKARRRRRRLRDHAARHRRLRRSSPAGRRAFLRRTNH